MIWLIGAIFVIFPGTRVLFKGFGNKLVRDMAKTPEGAKAVYDENIKEISKYRIVQVSPNNTLTIVKFGTDIREKIKL